MIQGDLSSRYFNLFESWANRGVKIVFDQAVSTAIGHETLAYGQHLTIFSEIFDYRGVITTEISGHMLTFFEIVQLWLYLDRVPILLDLSLF